MKDPIVLSRWTRLPQTIYRLYELMPRCASLHSEINRWKSRVLRSDMAARHLAPPSFRAAFLNLFRVLVTSTILCHGNVACATPAPENVDGAEEEIKRLIVMIRCDVAEDKASVPPMFGAGIIFGMDKDRLYVVTALHVIQHCRQKPQLQLRFASGRILPGEVTDRSDSILDLAVLTISGPTQFGSALTTLPFDRLGIAKALTRGTRLYSLGQPEGKPWATNVTPELFSRGEGDRLFFESNFIGPGHSGGALLNDSVEIVGLLLKSDPPEGQAINIQKVMERLRQWNFPISLGDTLKSAKFDSITAAEGHACGVTTEGVAYCWGKDDWGRLGYGADAPDTAIKRVVGGLIFRSLSAGRDHTCGVTISGGAYCWGSNVFGEFGNGKEREGSSNIPTAVSGGLTFKSVSAGLGLTCGITTTDRAYCWGRLFSNPEDRTSLVPVPVAGDLRYNSLSAGHNDTCGVATSGPYCLEQDAWGQLNHATTVPGDVKFVSLSTFGEYPRLVCGLTAVGQAYCWGHNDYGQLGNGAGGDRNTSANDAETPVPVSGGIKFKAIYPGLNHVCGIADSGAGYCWGDNQHGQLGNGKLGKSNVPVPISGALKFVSISAGYEFNCGISTIGDVYCWGRNNNGQLGNGSEADSSTPVRLRLSR